MIPSSLYRRSLRRALRWRVVFLWWAALAVPGAIAAAPVFAFFRARLDRATVAREVVAFIDGATLIELARELAAGETGHSILFAAGAALLILFLCAPFLAAAMVASARAEESLPFRRLLAAAGELYGRMLRLSVAGLVPLGIAAALAAGAFNLAADAARRASTETAADREFVAAACASALALFLAHLMVDAARSWFAADPDRRSAVVALWSALQLLWRHPFRALGIGGMGSALGLGGAVGLMALRLQLVQGTLSAMALAWLLAQGAQVAIGFGRAVRIEGLAELFRVRPTTLDALEPPRSGAPR